MGRVSVSLPALLHTMGPGDAPGKGFENAECLAQLKARVAADGELHIEQRTCFSAESCCDY
jgi:hypothetical protein